MTALNMNWVGTVSVDLGRVIRRAGLRADLREMEETGPCKMADIWQCLSIYFGDVLHG